MNAQAILEKINQDARELASAILNDAGERTAAMNAASESKIASMRRDTESRAAIEGNEMEQRMIRMDELEQKKLLLSAKREQLDRAFDLALEKMRSMPDEQAKAYLKRVLLSACEGDEAVIVGTHKAACFSQAFIDDVNAALVAEGRKGKLSLSGKKREGVTGVILSRSESEIDCTFEALLGASRFEMEQTVATILFP